MMYFADGGTDKVCPLTNEDSSCRGSNCAMWRWKPEINPHWQPKSVTEFGAVVDYRTEPPPYIDSNTHGYCGLANRPSFQ